MAVFTPVEEVERSLVVPLEQVEEGVRDFFKEGWVEKAIMSIMLKEDLEEVVEGDGLEEVEEDILEEAAVQMKLTPVVEGEDLTTVEKISKMNVVIKQLAMVR